MGVVRLFLSVLLFLMSFLLSAQPWVESGLDANGNPNFFRIQEAAVEYFNNIPIEEKGTGYKAYKRWEYNWTDRVYEDGSFPEAGINEKNFNEFLKNYKNNDRNVVTANWTNLGPNTTSGGYAGLGRINCVAFHPTNSNIMWVGSPGGGLWKTTDGGNNWTTNFDNAVVLGVSSIVVHPTTPNIMYIATGDGDGSDTYSVGILKSTDGGVTWQTTGLNWNVSQGRRIRKILMDPDDTNMLLAATSDGLYRTINAGSNWTQIVTGSFFDIEANPAAISNTFYASTGNGLFTSTNNGSSWTLIQTIGSNNRIALAVSPNNSSVVYALCSNSGNSGFNGMYKSADNGTSYSLVSSTPNILGSNAAGTSTTGQGWYDLCINVDPTNANIVYTGGINIWKSVDGGVTWALRTHWSGASGVQTVHADQHALEWQNSTTLWLGNDGGIYRTLDGGVTWTHRTNTMEISQMYRVDVSQMDSKIITGLQDNGTKIKGTDGVWFDRIGGDGMDCHISPTNASVMYASYQYGNFSRSTNGSSFSSMSIADANTGAWITPLAIDPSNTQNVYVGYNRIHKSTNQGGAWTPISSNISGSDLTYLFVSPSNSNVLYSGTSSALYYSTDAGINWTTKTIPGSSVQEIVIHPNDPNIIWAIRSNYNAGEKVYKSINNGTSWTNISGNLPNLPANCIIYQVGTQDGLYVGMDVGIYYKDNTMANWELYNANLPNVRVRDLKIKNNTQEIFAATYGRGAWKSPVRGANNCFSPPAITVQSIDINTATIQWTAPTPPPSGGYQYAINSSTVPPASSTATTNTTASFTGLNSNTNYYFHVRSVCADGQSSWSTSGPHITRTTCNDVSTDTGGASADYSDNENTIRYICPGGPYQQAVITFTAFEAEPQYDALYVYNGLGTNAPMFASSNPATISGFPAGGYYGTTFPGPFTSTDPSGCLTLQFRSDGSVTKLGWSGNVSCIDNCTSSVRSINDDGQHSLRNVMACAAPGTNIVFTPLVHNQTIQLLSPIVVSKNLNIIMTTENTTIQSIHPGYIFEVLPGVTLTIQNLKLIGGTGNTNTRVIYNRGILNMTDVDILDTKSNLGTGKSVDNQGNSTINGLYRIRPQ
ncbi:MAG: fibronectin type III domain-containing protein [Saprospiraceae bacterium]|nr:fibronectin type III domain-containing protein [Saprospiraceae bacterium]